jgi:agmatine deiminase
MTEGWVMPAEWQPHERTWMAWMEEDYSPDSTPESAEEMHRAWAKVANTIVAFEPVTMLVSSEHEAEARNFLDPRVEILLAKIDDGWMRDSGPTFVKAGEKLAAVDWIFNGWGNQGGWASWENDDAVASLVASELGISSLRSTLVNEGGGIHVNGAGAVLLTETVQLGEARNPGWKRAEVEAEIHAKLGTDKAIWIRRGLTRDYEDFGTQGHVDIVACFANEGTILFHDQQNPDHPDFSVSHEVRRTLEESGGFKLVGMPAPTVLRDAHGVVDYSYINHYICNGAVILCAFDDPNDAVAKAILEEVYPGREIILVDARALFARGGGIHCITQQQPK